MGGRRIITIKKIDMEELKITETKKIMRIDSATYRIEAERDSRETVATVWQKPNEKIVCSASFDRGFPFGLMAEAIRRMEEAGL